MRFQIRLAAAILFACLATSLFSQTPTATLVGIVKDSSGDRVTNAAVEIRNADTNEVRKVFSGPRGEFLAPNLAPGIYAVGITKEGFRALRQTGLELQLDQEARIEFSLEVGSLAQTVQVEASAPVINTENAAKGDVIVAQEMVEMPLNGRDFTDLAMLVPGVLPNSDGTRGSVMAVNGARADNTNFLIDGFNNQNPRDSNPQARPNLDAMQEFKMQTSGYSAETGRLAGGVINTVLKSGGNRPHGALFEFLRNDVVDARNFFNTSKSALRRNQFGATLDGPVYIPKLYNGRDHTFFLFSWESYRQATGLPRLGVVPSLLQRQGDFSGLAPLKDALAAGACTAASAAACFPRNQIPQSRLSPISLAMQAYYPLPNRTGVNNYYADARSESWWDSYVVKIDQHLRASDTLSFRYLTRTSWGQNPFATGNLGTFVATTGGPQRLAGLTYTHLFSPRLINEARFGLTRTVSSGGGDHQGIDYNARFGIPGLTTDPKLIGFPWIQMSGYEGLGDASNLPQQAAVTNYNAADTVTWVKSRHLIKFGGEVLRFQWNNLYDNYVRGVYAFTGSWTTQPYADFLLGLLNNTHRVVGTNVNYLRTTNSSFFFQDDWKVTPRLTLNLGLRYELPTPPHDKYGRWSNFIPELNKWVMASNASLVAANAGFANPSRIATAEQLGLPGSLVYANHKNLAPRFGFAWRPFGGNRTVVRGGYGIFYGTQLFNDVLVTQGQVFPFIIDQQIGRMANNPGYLTLANPFPVQPSLTSFNLTTASAWQLHAPTPYLQSWNLTIERDLGGQSAVELSYTGSKGTHLNRIFNLNQPYRSAATAPIFPVPYPGWGNINYYGFYFNSIYNGATATFRRRFSHNLFYRASYVYAKSIDSGSQLGTLGQVPSAAYGMQDPRNFRLERGRSDWDIGHSFTTSFSWSVPAHNRLLRGWEVAGTGTARTGAPITPMVSNINANLGEAVRPNRIGTGKLANPTPDRWFDPRAFPVVPDGSFTFGASGRDILDRPGTIQFNLALDRNFTIRERSKLQIRWEMFNALNHANFGAPVYFVNQPNAGTITSAADPRLMQLARGIPFERRPRQAWLRVPWLSKQREAPCTPEDAVETPLKRRRIEYAKGLSNRESIIALCRSWLSGALGAHSARSDARK